MRCRVGCGLVLDLQSDDVVKRWQVLLFLIAIFIAFWIVGTIDYNALVVR